MGSKNDLYNEVIWSCFGRASYSDVGGLYLSCLVLVTVQASCLVNDGHTETRKTFEPGKGNYLLSQKPGKTLTLSKGVYDMPICRNTIKYS